MEGAVFCLEINAALEFADGHARPAAVLIGAADAIRERLEVSVWPVLQARRAELLALLAETLGPDVYASALAEGRTSDAFDAPTWLITSTTAARVTRRASSTSEDPSRSSLGYSPRQNRSCRPGSF